MLQGTAEPIEFPHYQRVSVAAVIDGFSQAFSRIDSAAGDIAEDLFAPSLLESVLLQVRILVGGGNPCIADPHAQTSLSQNSTRIGAFETLISRGIATAFMQFFKPGAIVARES
jgi:hypothetical protein